MGDNLVDDWDGAADLDVFDKPSDNEESDNEGYILEDASDEDNGDEEKDGDEDGDDDEGKEKGKEKEKVNVVVVEKVLDAKQQRKKRRLEEARSKKRTRLNDDDETEPEKKSLDPAGMITLLLQNRPREFQRKGIVGKRSYVI